MYRLGVDVGGTFTDLFAWNVATGETRTAKVLTTRHDLVEGVLRAVEVSGIALSEVESFIHGSTTAINALIERKYPEPALVTTEGFRDTIEIGRQRRRHLYDPYQTKPEPLVRRRNRFTVSEKIRADGTVSRPLDEEGARRVAREIKARGIQNVAIGFINSYANSTHEERMREIVLEEMPGARVALSSDVPKFRELGRFVTAVVRAALLPVMGDYLTRLEDALRDRGFTGVLYVIKSNGGMATAGAAREHPEELIESGPAGGAAAAGVLSGIEGRANVISTDMGGTSFDVSLIEEGRVLVRDDYEIDWDLPIVRPILDIRSIGAGGGSIAWIDEGGSLRVGPISAGADPGPACYGKGGSEPTVTDANLVLGRLDPTLGGKLELDMEAARRAIEKVAKPLGMDVFTCAEGIVRICAENMASAIKLVTVDRGRDPRDHALVSFGGAGPLHACAIARSVGITTVIVPPFAGVASAFGATVLDVRHDFETTLYMPCASADVAELNRRYEALEAEAREVLAKEGFSPEEIELHRSAAMRYIGQSYEVDTPVPGGLLTEASVAAIEAEFHRVHEREYGVASPEFSVAFVNLRVTAQGKTPKPPLTALGERPSADGGSPVKGRRTVHFAGASVEVDVVDGGRLDRGYTLTGPAIVEHADSTVFVEPGVHARVDEHGNLLLSVAVPEVEAKPALAGGSVES
jgi:N-methylhydantoinase A